MEKIKTNTEPAKPTNHDMFILTLSVINIILAMVRLMLLIRDICSEDGE